MKRKLLTLLLACFACLSVSAYDFCVEGIYYNINDTSVEVTYKSKDWSRYSGSVTIPESVTYNNFTYPVTSIGKEAFSNSFDLTSVTVPNSVTSIGDYAFDGCSGLTSVTIPNSVTSIGSYAFFFCRSLTSVTIPNSVTSVGKGAFCGCNGLTSVAIPNSVTSIGKEAFEGCSGLGSVTIPNSVTSIGEKAFYGCSGLTSVTIPNSVTEICSYTFYRCSGLTSVTIPNSVTEIGQSAFEGCTSLTAFYGKYASTDNRCLIVDGKLNSFAPSGKTSYNIPNSVTSIGGYAFRDCSGLTSVTIPNSVTSINGWAFQGCSSLTSVTIPNSVTDIGGRAFDGCCGLTSVTIPNSVTFIGWSAFEDCTRLTSITVKNDNPANISLGSSVFSNVPRSTCILNVPEGCKSLYAAAAQWNAFTNIEEFSNVRSLTDGEAYTGREGQDDVDVEYTRTFTHTNWQSLYVPFNMSYGEWSEYADVAELYNVRSVDNDSDGVIDEIVIEFNKLTSGEIVPNVPYLIKPLASGTVSFECSGKTLLAAPAENGSVDCSSTKEVFTLYGVYESMNFLSHDSSVANYTLVNEEFVVTDAATEIPAGSIYLAITPKMGGYNPSAAPPAHVKLSVIGDNGSMSAIDDLESVNGAADAPYYDLMGRRVENPGRGIYIHNGRKVLVK